MTDFNSLLDSYQAAKQGSLDKVRSAGSSKSYGLHHCKTCDFSFKSREMLFDHLSTHIQCDHEDCNFVGVQQAVSKHKREEHEESESVQVFAMEHPEVLNAWLDQRRKNFPSSGNVQLKKLREEAKTELGITARDKSFTFKDRKWGVKRHKPCLPTKESDPLSGILGSKESKETKPGLLGLGAYDSSESETETDKSLPSAPDVHKTLTKFKKYAKIRSAEGKRKRERVKWNGIMKSGRRRFQPTLLQRLLSKEIQAEHNTILQCIRFIVDNNFFDPVKKTETTAQSTKPETTVQSMKPETTVQSMKPETIAQTVGTETLVSSVETETPVSSVETETPVSSVETETLVSSVETETQVSSVETETPVSSVETERVHETNT